MTEYKVYRNGTKIQGRIKAAVAHFYQQSKKLPVTILVHKSVLASEVEAARAAVRVLELNLAVTGNAGPLVGEVWLQTHDNNDKKPALQQAELFREEGNDG